MQRTGLPVIHAPLDLSLPSMDDLVEFQSQVRLDDSTPLSDLFVTGSGKSYGGEFLLRKTDGQTISYGDFLISSQQDEATLDEPRFHVTGGIGLCASMAADSVIFRVE